MGESGAAATRWPHVPGLRYTLAALVVVAALLALPAGASALKLRPCASDSSFGCGTLRVPLDHGGRTPGTVSIAVAAQRSYPKDAGLLIALSGGPGQGTVAATSSFAVSLEPMLRKYRMVVLDQRGTGLSGALNCPGLQRVRGLDEFKPEQIRDCARTIGPRRAFYRTTDTVADLEDLRKAFGAKKVAVMGISYGTWVAQEYARTHPERTESLILDSIVGPEPTDAFGIDGYGHVNRVLRELCSRGRCRSATSDVVADLDRVAARSARGPLRGPVYDTSGRRHTTAYTAQSQLFFLVSSGDLNPFIQARLPGALNAAARGDLGPLLRLKRMGDGPPSSPREFSWGLMAATGCLDATLPFSFASDPATRAPLVDRAFAAIPPASYAPWSAETVKNTSYADDCLLWPRDDRVAAPRGPLPNVRALLLAGRLDMRTPVEDAVRVQALLPKSQLVTVPGNGHDQVDSDGTGCVARALERFVQRRRVGQPCRNTSNLLPPIPRAPRTLAEIRPPASVPGDRGRALLAALRSVEDARFTGLEAVYSGWQPRGGGLRGGSFSATDAFQGTLTLRDYSYVPGVRVSGRVTIDGPDVTGRVTVSGRYAGTLDLRSTRAASGVLGGRRVAVAVGSGASAARAAADPGAFPEIPPALLDPAAASRRPIAR